MKGPCCKKVFFESVRSLLRESCDLKGRINLPGAPMSPAFLYARGVRHGSVEGPDMWNQVLDNALQKPAGRWDSEGIGFMLVKDYRKAQKRRRGSSSDAVKDEGRVLHHMCWAHDLYAMASTMNHLIRILEDMTNAIERFGHDGKRKVLPLLLDHSRSTNLEMLLRSSAAVVDAESGGQSRLLGGQYLVQNLQSQLHVFYAKKALLCDPKLPVKRRIDAFYSTYTSGEPQHLVCCFETLAVCTFAERAMAGAAIRRRQRFLRSMWRHEQLSLKMMAASMSHHSW